MSNVEKVSRYARNSLAMETNVMTRDDRSARIKIRASAIVLLDGIKSRGAGLLTFT